MKIRKFVFFILLLAVSVLLCSLVSSLMKYKILDINDFGFQFLFYSILGSIIYFALSNLRLFDSVAISVFLALIFAFILRRTSLILQFGSFLNLILYAVSLFAAYTLIFRFLWFNNAGYLRNIVFSLASAFVYTLVHLVTHLLLGLSATSSVFLRYFTNGFLMMITLSFAFSITELIFTKIDPIFFLSPGATGEEDEEDEEEEE
jgi:hypothetical protein